MKYYKTLLIIFVLNVLSIQILYSKMLAQVSNEVLVRFKANVSSLVKESILSKMALYNVRAEESSLIGEYFVGEVPSALHPGKVIEEFEHNDALDFVRPNYIYTKYADFSPEPYFYHQWAIAPQSDTDYRHANVVSAWKDDNLLGADCEQVPIAILDSGIGRVGNNYLSEFSNSISSCTGFKSGVTYACDDDDDAGYGSHGTRVASIIGADGYNASGISGLCRKSTLMIVKILHYDASNDATQGTTTDFVKGLEYATQNGAKIVSLSLGGSEYKDRTMDDAIYAATYQSGVIVVAASGNNGNDLDAQGGMKNYPCALANQRILCVTALDQYYSIPSYANYGQLAVDLAAPGDEILSMRRDGNFDTESGTSMAVPFVSAAAAMLWQGYKAKGLDKSDFEIAGMVILALKEGGLSLSNLKDKTYTGKALDVYGSFKFLSRPRGLSYTTIE